MSTELKRMQQRRDVTADWESDNPVLLPGELGLDTTLNLFKVGDGTSEWLDLPYIDFSDAESLILAGINDPTSPIGEDLADLIGDRGDVMLGVVGALEAGTDSCGVSVISDSTGVPTTAFPYLLADKVADDFPDFTVHTRTWNDSAQDYDRPTVVQTGTAGERYAQMAAASPTALTQRFTTPTGDQDVRIRLQMPDWTPASTSFIMQHWNADVADNSFIFRIDTDGTLQWSWYPDGSIGSSKTAVSTVAVPFANGTTGWVRVTHDIDNGAAGNDVKFWTSTDGATWTQLGSTVTNAGGSAVTTIFASTREFQLGSATPNTKYYEVEVRNGINGPSVAPRLADLWNRTIGTGPATINGAPVFTVTVGAQNGAGIGYDDNSANVYGYLNNPTRLPKFLPDFGMLALILNTGINEYELGGVTWVNRLSAWVTAARALLPGADPIVFTSVPVISPTYSQGPRRRRPWTLALARRAAEMMTVMDTAQAMLDDGRSLSVLLGGDEVHPTTAGYLVHFSPLLSAYEAARKRISFQPPT